MWTLLMLFACSDVGITEFEPAPADYEFEVFEYAPLPGQVDILFVIDPSGSMNDGDWSEWPAELHDMVNVANQSETDWRLGFVSGDYHQSDYLIGGKHLDKTSASNDINSVGFSAANEVVGFYEQGLTASIRAFLSEKLDAFWREDASPYFIFLSDENDQSGMSPTEWFSTMDVLVPEDKDYVVASIVATPDSFCTQEIGYSYIQISDIVIDICQKTSWDKSLGLLGSASKTIAYYPSYELKANPVKETIEVWIGDSISDEWVYESETNSVRIEKEMNGKELIGVSYLKEEF